MTFKKNLKGGDIEDILEHFIRKFLNHIIEKKLNVDDENKEELTNNIVQEILNNTLVQNKIAELSTKIDSQIKIGSLMSVEEIIGIIPEVGDLINGILDIGFEGFKSVQTAENFKALYSLVENLINIKQDKNQSDEMGESDTQYSTPLVHKLTKNVANTYLLHNKFKRARVRQNMIENVQPSKEIQKGGIKYRKSNKKNKNKKRVTRRKNKKGKKIRKIRRTQKFRRNKSRNIK